SSVRRAARSMVRRAVTARVSGSNLSTFQETKEVTPMPSKFPWINQVFRLWTRGKSDKRKRRPFRRFETRPCVEQLEVRELMTGAISLSGGALALPDTGAPTITMALASNNYTLTDSNGLSGTIPGWTISGDTATETDGLAGNITQLNFTTTNGTFGNS